MTRLLVQLEELEGRFGEHERFLADILARREEIHDTFVAHRQQLLDARQSRARTLGDAATRMLASILAGFGAWLLATAFYDWEGISGLTWVMTSGTAIYRSISASESV